jgi:3',5'-cyclic AMP phosphodiesterase CpdA
MKVGPMSLWLEETLWIARADATIDWIVVQMHQSALSSSTDNGCDVGIRQAWLPLFERYEVDLVVNGHDHDYERSYPVRGFTPGLGTSTFAGGTVTTFTQIRTGAKPTADATEPAAWSAMTDPVDAYGVAHFQVDPGEPGENTTITVTYYHAPTQTSGTPDYSVLETFQLTRPRRDRFFGVGNREKAAAGSGSR